MPGLSPWPTLIALLALARVRAEQGAAREALAEAHTILQSYPDSGIFPSLLDQQQRGLHNKTRKKQRPDRSLDGELTERELDVLSLFVGELSTTEIAQRLYVAPSTVRTQVKFVYRKLGVSSRKPCRRLVSRGSSRESPHQQKSSYQRSANPLG